MTTAKEVYRLTGGQWLSSDGGVFQPPYISPTGRVTRVRGGAVYTPPVSDGFIVGTTKPDASNAGLPDGWAPARTFTTAQVITSAGATIENVLFNCNVDVRATGLTFNNCYFQGAPDMGVRAAVYQIDSGCNVGPANIYNRCLFQPQHIADGCDALMGYNYTLNRCESTHGGDGTGSYIPPTIGTDLRITRNGNYVHDLLYWCPSTGHSDGHSHNDGDQHHNGNNIVINGDNIEGFWAPDVGLGQNDPGVKSGTTWTSGNCNSLGVANGPRNCNAVLQFNKTSVCDDYHVINSWLSGGISTFNLLDTSLNMTNLELTGNRITTPLGGKGAVLNCYSAASAIVTASGNTYNGSPISLAVGDGRTNKT